MIYPVFSYDDGTEVTASKPDEKGKVLLHVEKFDAEKDSFIYVTFVLPDMEVESFQGYDQQEMEDLRKKYSDIKEDIMGFVKEKEELHE